MNEDHKNGTGNNHPGNLQSSNQVSTTRAPGGINKREVSGRAALSSPGIQMSIPTPPRVVILIFRVIHPTAECQLLDPTNTLSREMLLPWENYLREKIQTLATSEKVKIRFSSPLGDWPSDYEVSILSVDRRMPTLLLVARQLECTSKPTPQEHSWSAGFLRELDAGSHHLDLPDEKQAGLNYALKRLHAELHACPNKGALLLLGAYLEAQFHHATEVGDPDIASLYHLAARAVEHSLGHSLARAVPSSRAGQTMEDLAPNQQENRPLLERMEKPTLFARIRALLGL